jgi:hypothetical protein
MLSQRCCILTRRSRIANAVLAVRAAYELKIERSQRSQQETFIVH